MVAAINLLFSDKNRRHDLSYRPSLFCINWLPFCLIRKGSGIVMTQEQSNQNECQILIYSVQDFLARHSLSPESEKDLQMQEELSFLKLPGLEQELLHLFLVQVILFRHIGNQNIRQYTPVFLLGGQHRFRLCEFQQQERKSRTSDSTHSDYRYSTGNTSFRRFVSTTTGN